MISSSEITYIGLDLDGTLLNSKKEISEETVSLLRSLHSNGIKIILVSGRHFREMKNYVGLLGLHEFDYVISCDGQYIYNGSGLLQYKFPFLSKTDLYIISKICKDSICYFFTDEEDFAFRPRFINRLYKKLNNFFKRKSSRNMISNISSQVKNEIQIEKIRVTPPYPEDFIEQLRIMYIVHPLIPKSRGVEVLNYAVNKYNALMKLQDLGKVNLNQMVYFGNDFNDYECFEHLQHTVAMSDSPELIKHMASSITDDCDHLGVYKALTKLYCNKLI